MLTVKNILANKQKSFNSIRSSDLVINALNLLNSVNLSYLVVLDGEQYKGIFSERDYTRNVVLKGRSSDSTTVGEVMTTDLPIVDFSDSIEHCMNLMNSHKTRYLLAYDDQDFRAVITIHDLLRQVIANKEEVFDHTIAESLLTQDESSRIY